MKFPLHAFKIEFIDVLNFRFSYEFPGHIAGFVVDDVSNRQWEGMSFRVGDDEDGIISFYCGRIRVERA